MTSEPMEYLLPDLEEQPGGQIFRQLAEAMENAAGYGHAEVPTDERVAIALFLMSVSFMLPDLHENSDIAIGADGSLGLVIGLPRVVVTLDKHLGQDRFDIVSRDRESGEASVEKDLSNWDVLAFLARAR